MLTCTGAQVDLRCMRTDDISLLDIAHALANINRYTGHAVRPMSVAEHSLLVVEIMEREQGASAPDVLLAALLHDAHEAYIGDLATPLKQLLGPLWAREEGRIQKSVLARFGALNVYWRHERAIKAADLQALATERRDLMPDGGPAWPSLDGVQAVSWINLRSRDGMGWEDWRQAYLDRFAVLYAIDAEAGIDGLLERAGPASCIRASERHQ